MLNPKEKEEILKKELELKNLEKNIFQQNDLKEDLVYYNPSIEEYYKNHSIKPKFIKGFIFCNYYDIYLE